MKRLLLGVLLILLPGARLETPAQARVASCTTNHLGTETNAPAIWESWAITTVTTNPPPTNIPPRFLTNSVLRSRFTQTYTYTNRTFKSFLPGTLHHLIWTNFLTLTNKTDLRIWSVRRHPPDWPGTPPEVRWNTNCIFWGLQGVTALSPCWEGEGAPGQIPLTALTRRHVYARGHGMGESGINDTKNRQKVWFLTPDNSVFEARIVRAIVRSGPDANQQYRDYTIMLLDRDLPESIVPLAVAAPEDVQKYYGSPSQGVAPHPLFLTEQTGAVSTSVPPLTVNTWKGGDSGSPNLIPLPGRLVFVGGRSTSGPSRAMQADLDELCRLEQLNPAKYQLRWVELGKSVTE